MLLYDLMADVDDSNRVQCRDGVVQEHKLSGLGSRWAIEYTAILAMLLCKHPSEYTIAPHHSPST